MTTDQPPLPCYGCPHCDHTDRRDDGTCLGYCAACLNELPVYQRDES